MEGWLPQKVVQPMAQKLSDPAVFARQHSAYLAYAAKVARSSRSTLVAFGTNLQWTGAAQLLDTYSAIPIYFAIIGKGPELRYQAVLVKVGPARKTARARAKRPPRTGREKWATHYLIRNCRPIAKRASMSQLIKLSDGNPINKEFRYAYSLVLATKAVAPERSVAASDIEGSPARRVEQHVLRIVRDTMMVRRLKALHRNHCQICGRTITLRDGSAYSEGHHLRPLGGKHRGHDTSDNVVILCPNHHAMFDYRAISVRRAVLRPHRLHKVSPAAIRYHNKLFEAEAT